MCQMKAEANREKEEHSTESSRYGITMLARGDHGVALFPGDFSAAILIRPAVSPGMD